MGHEIFGMITPSQNLQSKQVLGYIMVCKSIARKPKGLGFRGLGFRV